MKNKNELYNIDAILAYAAKASLQEEIDTWPSDTYLKENYSPSPASEKRMNLLIKKSEHAQRWKIIRKQLKRVAAIILVFLSGTTVLFGSVQAVQQAVIATVIEWRDLFAEIGFISDNPTNTVLPENISITYWPKGYDTEIINQEFPALFVQARKNKNDDMINIRIEHVENASLENLDNEYSDFITVEIDGIRAIWTSSPERINNLVWKYKEMILTISSKENINELVKIMQSIKY